MFRDGNVTNFSKFTIVRFGLLMDYRANGVLSQNQGARLNIVTLTDQGRTVE